MKKFYIILIAMFMVNGAIGQSNQPCATCLSQGITFSTQSQINNFQNNYPGCTQILGYVKIMGSNITNLNGLSVLTSMGGYLFITYNLSLTSLSGLEGLTSIGGTLSIESNNALTNLTGLKGLTSLGGSGLWIDSNPVLTSLTGLENLISVDGGTQGGYLSIHDNSLLTDLSGLEGLVSIGRDLEIYNNNALTSLTGLEGLNSIGGDLSSSSNTSLISLVGLNNLTSIGGSLVFYWNSSLTSVIGLEGLTTIGESITFGGNNTLTNFTGLQNLISISGSLNFYGNAALTSLSGLENINNSSITNLVIQGNPLLSSCDVQSVCDYLVSPNGTIDIQNNAPGCNNQAEVEAACAALSVDKSANDKGFKLYPNPASTSITIETITKGSLSFLTLNSQQLITHQITEPKTQIDISNLPKGVYFVRVTNDKTVEVGKFIKQ